jgi:carboxymethylenebutenolidase
VHPAIRIKPSVAELRSRRGPITVAELYLGGVPRGAAVLLCAWGAEETDTAELMNRLAEHGYESVAADIARGADADGAPLSDDGLVSDVLTLLDRLALRGWAHEQIGVVGYGLGGRAALLAASECTLGAAVSVNPSGVATATGERLPTLLDSPRGVRTPWLGMFGDRGEQAGRAAAGRLGSALDKLSPVYTQLVVYRGVAGDFYRDSPESAAHTAAFDCWQRIVEWLNLRVVPRLTPLAEAWRRRQLPDEQGLRAVENDRLGSADVHLH